MDTIDYSSCPHFYSNMNKPALVPLHKTKPKAMCHPHLAFLLPCLTCLMLTVISMWNTYIYTSFSVVYLPLGLCDTASPAFSPLLFLYHSLRFAGCLWALSQVHLSLFTLPANFISHGCNHCIYVPTEPFFQVPGSDIHTELPGWLHLDCPTGTSDLTYLKSSKSVLHIFWFGFFSFLKKFMYFQDFLRTH